MLRKSQTIMLLLLAAFIFSIPGIAGAANFTDVPNTNAQSAAIYKLNSLGIIAGYPDGTFGPDKTITRAEFAKIACATAGLSSVASGMTSNSSLFNDVNSDFWANGWINTAAAQGYVKGDPTGTFRPNDQVTQAEVLTVLLRIIGYNDNLPGNWPSDYISKAASLGITDDINFVAGKGATRGEAAVMGSNTLETKIVDYIASDNYFKESEKGSTLLEDKFSSSSYTYDEHKDLAFVYDLDLSGGKQRIEVLFPDDKNAAAKLATGNFVSYELAPGCVIAGNLPLTSVPGRYIEFVLNDDDQVTYIEVKQDSPYKIIKGVDPADVERISPTRIKINGHSYDIDPNFNLYSSDPIGIGKATVSYAAGYPNKITRPANSGFLANPAAGDPVHPLTKASWCGKDGQTLDDYLESLAMTTETIDLILNKDGDIVFVKGNVWPTQPNLNLDVWQAVGIVDQVNVKNAKITFKNSNADSIQLDKDDPSNYVIIKNGKPATLNDVASDDLLYLFDRYNTDFIIALSAKITGKFTNYETDKFLTSTLLDKVTIGDKTYKAARGGGYLSTDEGENFAPITNAKGAIDSSLDDILDEDVTAYLTPTGAVIAISSGSSSSKIYGIINDDDGSSLVNGKIEGAVEVLKADGTMAAYAKDGDSEIYVNGAWADLTDARFTSDLNVDDFVELTLNPDGYIDQIKVNDEISDVKTYTNAVISGDEDEKVVKINGDSYDAAEAVIFNTSLDPDSNAADEDEADTVGLADFLDDADNGFTAAGQVLAKIKDGKLQYLVLNDPAHQGSDNNIAMITKVGKDSDGDFVYLMTNGDATKYQIKGDRPSSWTKGSVAIYKTVNDKIQPSTSTWAIKGTTLEVLDISGNIVEVGVKGAASGTTYYIDSDTLCWDYTNDDPAAIEASDLGVGDLAKVYQEEPGDALQGIVIVNQ